MAQSRRMMGSAATAAVMWSAVWAAAWDGRGHRIVTYVALDGLSPETPAWLRDGEVRDRIAYQSNEADRWRGVSIHPIGHENKPDHYLDVEYLDWFGLTLETVPKHRYEYLRAMAISKHVHPEKVGPYDAAKDEERVTEWPGYLPHAIGEHYAKLVGAMNTVRILEKLNEPRRKAEYEMAKANMMYHMGMLSHFVADAAQPLHTTRHHHGWEGENPKGYTTERGFHSYIDGGVLRHHGIVYETIQGKVTFERRVNGADPWEDTLRHIRRAFERVEPLYQLEKSGELKKAAGKAFIVERLTDGATMLAAMYNAAWEEAAPTDKQVADWVKYSDFGSEFPGSAATRPAGE